MELRRHRSTLLAAVFLAAGCVELLPKSPDLSGWSFNGIILIVDEHVVYTLYGGRPKVHTEETSRQPLGPLRNLDAVGKLVH